MSPNEPIRIQKHLAEAAICSRRAAEKLIEEGEVWVNGKMATIGQKVTPGEDKITVSGTTVKFVQAKVTLAMHKPRGVVCSNDDPHNPKTVFDLLPKDFTGLRFFCAGRLDKDSEGLLILTTDGELANRLMHPSNLIVKRYHVVLKDPYPSARLGQLTRGVMIEGEKLKVESAALVNPTKAKTSTNLDVHMHHGKKREIRQLFIALRHNVKRLRRYQIGSLRLKGIPLRAMKQLTSVDIALLFKIPRPHFIGKSTGKPASRS